MGDKREAAQYAARRGLWSHALVISSSVDPELWSEMVMKFAEAELQNSPDAAALRAAYTVFSGRTATSGEHYPWSTLGEADEKWTILWLPPISLEILRRTSGERWSALWFSTESRSTLLVSMSLERGSNKQV